MLIPWLILSGRAVSELFIIFVIDFTALRFTGLNASALGSQSFSESGEAGHRDWTVTFIKATSPMVTKLVDSKSSQVYT